MSLPEGHQGEWYVPNGSGTSPSGAGWVASARPRKTSSWGAPGQFATPTAAANMMLSICFIISADTRRRIGKVHVQVSGRDVVPRDNRALLVHDLVEPQARVEVGLDVSEERDRAVGTSTSTPHRYRQKLECWQHLKIKGTNPFWPRALIEGENAMASWKVRRRDSCTSSPHPPLSNRFCWRSSAIAKSWQHAAFVAVFLPSGHATRRVSAAATAQIYVRKRAPSWEGRGNRRTVCDLEGRRESDDGEESFEGHSLSRRAEERRGE